MLFNPLIRNLKQVIKGGDLNIHPVVAKLVDSESLEAMGAKRQAQPVAKEEQITKEQEPNEQVSASNVEEILDTQDSVKSTTH